MEIGRYGTPWGRDVLMVEAGISAVGSPIISGDQSSKVSASTTTSSFQVSVLTVVSA